MKFLEFCGLIICGNKMPAVMWNGQDFYFDFLVVVPLCNIPPGSNRGVSGKNNLLRADY